VHAVVDPAEVRQEVEDARAAMGERIEDPYLDIWMGIEGGDPGFRLQR
jgi:hypothetical protein